MTKIGFVDSSIILRHLLKESNPYLSFEKFDHLFSSELLELEVKRTIDRFRLSHLWPDSDVNHRLTLFYNLTSGFSTIPIQTPVIRRASNPFSVPIKSLDAIHLATAMIIREDIREPIIFLTHDRKLAEIALDSGFEVEGISSFKKSVKN